MNALSLERLAPNPSIKQRTAPAGFARLQLPLTSNVRPADPLENISKLMQFYAAIARQAPWPQVRAVVDALVQPLSEEDRRTLRPFLRWPGGPGGEGYIGRLPGGAGAA